MSYPRQFWVPVAFENCLAVGWWFLEQLWTFGKSCVIEKSRGNKIWYCYWWGTGVRLLVIVMKDTSMLCWYRQLPCHTNSQKTRALEARRCRAPWTQFHCLEIKRPLIKWTYFICFWQVELLFCLCLLFFHPSLHTLQVFVNTLVFLPIKPLLWIAPRICVAAFLPVLTELQDTIPQITCHATSVCVYVNIYM